MRVVNRASHFVILAVLSSGLVFARQEPSWFEEAVGHYWNGEYEQTLQVLSTVVLSDLSQGEKLEYYQYRAFSYIALGDNDSAQREFISLLSTDPGYKFDTTMVSPKVIEQFELSRQSLIETLFDQGKMAYFDKDYRAALGLMDKILLMDSQYRLAREYRRLCEEQIALTERIELLEAREVAAAEPEPEPPPPEEEPDDRIYHMSSDITPPVLVERVEPQYPAVDSLLRNEGRVVLLIIIEKDGSVQHARVVTSFNSRFDKSALDAVGQWKYEPATLNGRPVRLSMVISIVFSAGSAGSSLPDRSSTY